MAEGRNITAEVKRIIKEQLDVDEKDIKPESTFIDDLGADSLGLVELVLAFEEAFEIDIPDEDTDRSGRHRLHRKARRSLTEPCIREQEASRARRHPRVPPLQRRPTGRTCGGSRFANDGTRT